VSLAVVLGLTPNAEASPPQSTLDLVRTDRATLEALFTGGSVGDIPTGFLPGRAIPDPGSRSTSRKSKTVGLLWKGKVFHGDGTGHNRILGRDAVPVKVYQGESWRDGGPALIVDYSDSWRVFHGVRDEIREVSPGVYLGMTYVSKRRGPELAMMFALEDPRVRHDQ